MSKDKNSQQPIEDDSNDNSHNIPEQDIKKEKEDLNRRRALKTILGASSLMVINPFSMSAKQTGILVTQTASSSLTPTPSVSVSQSPSSSLTPTPSDSESQRIL